MISISIKQIYYSFYDAGRAELNGDILKITSQYKDFDGRIFDYAWAFIISEDDIWLYKFL